jgi:Holliday junction resolvase RusA-like endonuclease
MTVTLTQPVTFTVPGVPIAQPRQRYTRTGINYTPSQHPVQQWKARVVFAWHDLHQEPLAGPVRLEVYFEMPRPKKYLAKKWLGVLLWHVKRPDADNLIKAIKDALNGLAWHDDSQVCQLYVEKRYTAGGEEPKATITVVEVE